MFSDEELAEWAQRRIDKAVEIVNAEFSAAYPELAAQGFHFTWETAGEPER